MTKITTRHAMIALALVGLAAAILLWMGRPPICTCGTIKLWTGAVQSADNSQHIADFYTPSHIIHGFLFYGLGWLLLRNRPVGVRVILAVGVEAAWELVENSPVIIERYRAATAAFGYNGDSVLNSVADIGWMTLGFIVTRRAPVWLTVALAVAFELATLVLIRDNLALNVLMLVSPLDAVKAWQAGG